MQIKKVMREGKYNIQHDCDCGIVTQFGVPGNYIELYDLFWEFQDNDFGDSKYMYRITIEKFDDSNDKK